MTESNVIALNMNRERPAATMSGYMMLAILLLSIVAQVWGIYELANDNVGTLQVVTVIVAPIVLLFVACGFYMLQPNQAAAITLFGDYKGTDRTTGLRWVLPWLMRRKLSVRANNFISEKIKVEERRVGKECTLFPSLG